MLEGLMAQVLAHGPWPMARDPWPMAYGPWPMGPMGRPGQQLSMYIYSYSCI
jgi:hypothetical protein